MLDEGTHALDCTAQNMSSQPELVKPPQGKDQNSMENGRTTKLYY